MQNSCVAIIPARGGSKRIPKKNIKLFHGKPLIAYSIEVALKSKLFDKVIVSTDDEEIAKIARSYGADVPFLRPKELSDDFTGTGAVVNHAIEFLKQNGEKIDFEKLNIDKKEFVLKMKENNIGLQLHYIPINKQPYYKNLGYGDENTPEMDEYYQKAISLPIYPNLSLDEQNYVCEKILEILK